MAHWIGAAPRYFGNSEPWMLIDPRGEAASTAVGRIWPNATTTAMSAPSARRRSGHSGSRRRGGWMTGRPAWSAATLMGGGVSFWPRWAGRSGCVTTVTIVWARRSASKVGSANAGVP
jgi:hypothetical protein